MKIIEFTGVAGAGKSTICDLLEKELGDQGYRVLNLHVLGAEENLFEKVHRKYIWKRVKYSRINRNFKHIVQRLELSSEIDLDEWIQIIEVMNYRLHKEAGKYDYVLMDEGIIQAITALYHRMTIDNRRAIRTLLKTICKEYRDSTLIMNMNIDLNTVCDRLKNRNRADDDFLCDDEKNMKALLQQKKGNVDFVLGVSGFPIEQINANQSLDKVLADIMKLFLGK